MTKIIVLLVCVVNMWTVWGQGGSCFDGGCNLVTDAGRIQGTQYAGLQATQPNANLITAPQAVALITQRPCLLTSVVCAGRDGLNNIIPCCCEVLIGPGATADYLVSLDGKFKGNIGGLLSWNNIEEIQVGQVIQLCQTDDSIVAASPYLTNLTP